MALVTLRELRRRSRSRADMLLFGDIEGAVEPDYSNSFITNEELNEFINIFSKEYYNILTQADGEDYFNSTQQYSPSSSITLPSDFFKLNSLSINNNPIMRASKLEIKRSKPAIPTDTIILNYVPQLKKLVDTVVTPTIEQDTIDGINGYEEYIVLRTAMAMLSKEQTGNSDLLREFNYFSQKLEQLKEDRDEWMGDVIQDVMDDEYAHGFSTFKYRIIGDSVHFISGSIYAEY